MSLHFFQYSCGFTGFLKQNLKNGFTVDVQGKIPSETPKAGLPPDFQAGGPAFLHEENTPGKSVMSLEDKRTE